MFSFAFSNNYIKAVSCDTTSHLKEENALEWDTAVWDSSLWIEKTLCSNDFYLIIMRQFSVSHLASLFSFLTCKCFLPQFVSPLFSSELLLFFPFWIVFLLCPFHTHQLYSPALVSSSPLLSVPNTTRPFLTPQLFAGCFTNYHYACTHLGHIHRLSHAHTRQTNITPTLALSTCSDSRESSSALGVRVHVQYGCVSVWVSTRLAVQPFKESSNIYADVPVDPQASLGHMASTKKDGACVWRRAGGREG